MEVSSQHPPALCLQHAGTQTWRQLALKVSGTCKGRRLIQLREDQRATQKAGARQAQGKVKAGRAQQHRLREGLGARTATAWSGSSTALTCEGPRPTGDATGVCLSTPPGPSTRRFLEHRLVCGSWGPIPVEVGQEKGPRGPAKSGQCWLPTNPVPSWTRLAWEQQSRQQVQVRMARLRTSLRGVEAWALWPQ